MVGQRNREESVNYNGFFGERGFDHWRGSWGKKVPQATGNEFNVFGRGRGGGCW